MDSPSAWPRLGQDILQPFLVTQKQRLSSEQLSVIHKGYTQMLCTLSLWKTLVPLMVPRLGCAASKDYLDRHHVTGWGAVLNSRLVQGCREGHHLTDLSSIMCWSGWKLGDSLLDSRYETDFKCGSRAGVSLSGNPLRVIGTDAIMTDAGLGWPPSSQSLCRPLSNVAYSCLGMKAVFLGWKYFSYI